MPALPELYLGQLPYLPSCVQRAVILHRLLHRIKSEVKAQLPRYAYSVRNSEPGIQQSKLTHNFWACSVGPGPSWHQLQPWGLW